MTCAILRLAPFLLALPAALSAEPAVTTPYSLAAPDATKKQPSAIGGGDDFRRTMLDWTAPASIASRATDASANDMRLAAPLDRMRQSSAFGVRVDPINGRLRHHAGIDIPDQAGAPIHAAAGGVIAYAGWATGYGNLVVIRHLDGMETRYGHLSRMLAGMGQEVRQGQVIGLVGATGRATGNHLHFEVRALGRPIDPTLALDEVAHAGPTGARIVDDPPMPVVAPRSQWQSDPNSLPSPAL